MLIFILIKFKSMTIPLKYVIFNILFWFKFLFRKSFLIMILNMYNVLDKFDLTFVRFILCWRST